MKLNFLDCWFSVSDCEEVYINTRDELIKRKYRHINLYLLAAGKDGVRGYKLRDGNVWRIEDHFDYYLDEKNNKLVKLSELNWASIDKNLSSSDELEREYNKLKFKKDLSIRDLRTFETLINQYLFNYKKYNVSKKKTLANLKKELKEQIEIEKSYPKIFRSKLKIENNYKKH